MSSGNSINVTPVNTATQLLPLSDNSLPDPILNSSTCNVSGIVTLTYSCTVLIPVEVEWAAVQVQQFYTAQNPTQLDIYFVYDKSGPLSGQNNQYALLITVLKTDKNGAAIPLAQIKNIYSLVENVDPKTSRGTVTAVRRTGED